MNPCIHSSLPILSTDEMRLCDERQIASGTPSRELMERAARCVAKHLLTREELFPAGLVLCLCGCGNNGGDGFATARFLTDGSLEGVRDVAVVYTGAWDSGRPDATRMSAECARQYILAAEAGVAIHPVVMVTELLRRTAAVVDAVFGIGLSRPVEGGVRNMIDEVAASGPPVLAVDIPSGVCADSGAVLGRALPARSTVTIQALKRGLLMGDGADLSGEIAVCDIGISLEPAKESAWHLAGEELLRRVLPPRARRSHKGTYGRVALLCGSVGMSGAAVLSTRAALRSGAGLCKVVTPEENRVVLQSTIPEAIVTAYDASIPAVGGSQPAVVTQVAALRRLVREAVTGADSVVIGCGLGKSRASRVLLGAALNTAEAERPLILDADALNLLSEDESLWGERGMVGAVITPHPAEMSRLCGRTVPEILADPIDAAQEFAKRRGVTVVLKDARTVIASPEGACYICAAGNAGMATGGSGDALAGIIGALLAEAESRLGDGLTVAEVAAAGVYLHAKAGDSAAEMLGEYGLLPSDLIEAIPLVLRDFSSTRTVINRL